MPHQASLSFTIPQNLLQLMSIESMMPSNHLIFCHPLLLLPCLSQHESSPMSQLFASGGESIGGSASVLPMNIQDRFPLELTGWISLLSKELSIVFSSTTSLKHQLFRAQPSLWSNSYIHTWLLEKPLLWLYGPRLTVFEGDCRLKVGVWSCFPQDWLAFQRRMTGGKERQQLL